jgi:hypothetical protein
VYSVSTISTNEVCRGGNNITEMQFQSGDTINIKLGCYMRTMDHIISADESKTIKVKTGPEKSQICSTIGTKKQFIRPFKGSGPGTMANLMPPFSWTNWTNSTTRIHIGLLPHWLP